MVLDLDNGTISQMDFGNIVGISQPSVSDLLARRVLSPGATAGQWIREYCGNLREVAAGRTAHGDITLATERAALARVQRERIEIQNAESRGELVRVSLIEPRLKDAIIGAREYLRNRPFHLAQQAQGLSAGELESLLADTFDEFLRHLAKAQFDLGQPIEEAVDLDGDDPV